ASRQGFISIKGIVPALEPEVTNIAGAMKSGSLSVLEPREGETDGIVIGQALADKLHVRVGDNIRLFTPKPELSPMGMGFRPRLLRVVGVFTLGLFEFDESYGFVHLTVAERILDQDATAYIEVRVDDLFAAPS